MSNDACWSLFLARIFQSHSNIPECWTVAIAAHAQLNKRSARAASSGVPVADLRLVTGVTSPPLTAAISRWLSPHTLLSLAISNSSQCAHLLSGPTCSALSDSNLQNS